MTRAEVIAVGIAVLAAALGCSGYSDGLGGLVERDGGRSAHTAQEAGHVPVPGDEDEDEAADQDEVTDHDEVTDQDEDGHEDMHEPPLSPVDQVDPEVNLQLVRSARVDGYLADRSGNPLYMYAGDVSGVPASSCLGECAKEWPPFDVAAARPGPGIDPREVSRFHRQDGLWQTTYKGHALYSRAHEAGSGEVTGDGVNGRWFVARDYLAFLSSARTFTPSGGVATGDVFLTDGFGRTLYVCLNDQPRTSESEAVSSCDAACTVQRPIFAASETSRTTLLPSVIHSGDLRELVRPDGQRQLTYRGWPLYYYSGDVAAGATDGHNDRAWRAIDPVTFGINN